MPAYLVKIRYYDKSGHPWRLCYGRRVEHAILTHGDTPGEAQENAQIALQKEYPGVRPIEFLINEV
jgi:hypothetical protein